MSKLEELLEDYCPDGVEYKKIRDCYQRLRGTPITAAKMKEIQNADGDIKIFAGGKTVINAFEKDIPKANVIRVPSVLVQSRGIIDAVYYDQPFTFKNEMWAYTSDNPLEVKFLYYVLKNNVEYFRSAASGMGSLPQISLKVTEEFEVPVPPLPVQEEIVRILDMFTELTAELTARKKQYEYYRDQMLTPANDSIPNKNISEIAEICDSERRPITKGKRISGEYPYYGASGIVDYVKDYIFDGDYLLISEDGANLLSRTTPIAFSIKGKCWVNNHAHVLKFKDFYTQKFVEFYLNNIDLSPYISAGAQPKLNQNNLRKILIPLPESEKIQQIVTTLMHFEDLCTSISTGLPAEIEAREKQYEYYRDKLLTFKRKA